MSVRLLVRRDFVCMFGGVEFDLIGVTNAGSIGIYYTSTYYGCRSEETG